jgi:hypothetical protein
VRHAYFHRASQRERVASPTEWAGARSAQRGDSRTHPNPQPHEGLADGGAPAQRRQTLIPDGVLADVQPAVGTVVGGVIGGCLCERLAGTHRTSDAQPCQPRTKTVAESRERGASRANQRIGSGQPSGERGTAVTYTSPPTHPPTHPFTQPHAHAQRLRLPQRNVPGLGPLVSDAVAVQVYHLQRRPTHHQPRQRSTTHTRNAVAGAAVLEGGWRRFQKTGQQRD